jgi:preprotein translocase subunit Sec63
MGGIHWQDLNLIDCAKLSNVAVTLPEEITWRDIRCASNFYERLEVSVHASPEVIKRAYRALIEKYHPDKQPDDRRSWAEAITKELNEAYTVLRDQERRAAYDQRLGGSIY